MKKRRKEKGKRMSPRGREDKKEKKDPLLLLDSIITGDEI